MKERRRGASEWRASSSPSTGREGRGRLRPDRGLGPTGRALRPVLARDAVGLDGRLRSRSWQDADGNAAERRRGRREPRPVPLAASGRGGRRRHAVRSSCSVPQPRLGAPWRDRDDDHRLRRRAARRRLVSGLRADGLQVVGADEVTKVVWAVSASRELFEHAAAPARRLLLVHHGSSGTRARASSTSHERAAPSRSSTPTSRWPRTTSRSTRTPRSATTHCSPASSASPSRRRSRDRRRRPLAEPERTRSPRGSARGRQGAARLPVRSGADPAGRARHRRRARDSPPRRPRRATTR